LIERVASGEMRVFNIFTPVVSVMKQLYHTTLTKIKLRSNLVLNFHLLFSL